MGVLIITILASVLCALNVISGEMAVIILIGSIVWAILGALLYFGFGLLKFWYHDFLGWHVPNDSPQWSDGLSQHAVCKHCSKDIMQDSQGNWF